jgi:hypothetical protein
MTETKSEIYLAISIASSMDVQGVSPSTPSSMDVQGVPLF